MLGSLNTRKVTLGAILLLTLDYFLFAPSQYLILFTFYENGDGVLHRTTQSLIILPMWSIAVYITPRHPTINLLEHRVFLALNALAFYLAPWSSILILIIISVQAERYRVILWQRCCCWRLFRAIWWIQQRVFVTDAYGWLLHGSFPSSITLFIFLNHGFSLRSLLK